MPIDYKKYPTNWHSEIRPSILARAKNCCEFCGVPNYSRLFVKRKKAGVVIEIGTSRVVLTIAHLDHDITNNAPENLRALCQRCHLKYDQAHHAESRKRNRQRKVEQAGQMRLEWDEDNDRRSG